MRVSRSLQTCHLVGLAVVLAALLVASGVVRSADPHPYHEGNYGTAGLPHTDLSGSRAMWDYTNLNEWPELCRTGSRQSPISFTNVDPTDIVKDAPLKRLQFSSKCFFPKDETQMRIVNEGAVNMVSFERQGRLPEDLSECTVVDPLNKTRVFYFSELHFHATSEHKFRNLRPDVEMHISFTTDEVKEKKREVLMVAVMLKASTSINSTSVRALRHILVDGSLPRRHAMTTCFLTEDLSITSLLPTRESYLLYDGSETHPPCKENVRWVVMTSPILISRVAVGKLRDAMDQLLPNDFHRFGNARPPQALNGRRIYRFDDTSVPAGGRRSEGNLEDAWTRRNKQNGAGVMNETYEDDVFRLVDDSTFDDDVTIETYGDDAKEVLPRTTKHPENTTDGASSSAKAGEEKIATNTSSSSAAAAAAAKDVNATAPSADELVERMPNATTTAKEENETSGENATAISSEVPTTPVNTTEDAPHHEDSAVAAGNSTASSAGAQASADVAPANATTTTSTTTSTTSTTTTTTSTSTSTTKKPAAGKSKKSREPHMKNTSEAASDSGELEAVERSVNATASGAWSRLKNFTTRVVGTAVAYTKGHPGRAAIVVACFVALFFLIATCIRGWKSPVYVVGIDPRELQPLNPNSSYDRYGGTGAAAVRPANQRLD